MISDENHFIHQLRSDISAARMKRKIKHQIEKSKKVKAHPTHPMKLKWRTASEHPAWNIIISHLDFECQMKLSQLNKRLSHIVELNAGSKLRQFQRQIREDRYM